MKKFWGKYKYYILIFFICFSLMAAYQFLWISPDRLGGNDSYTHIAKAGLLKEFGVTAASYPSLLPFTYWAVINADNTIVFDYLILVLLSISTSVTFFKIIIAALFAFSSGIFFKILSFGQKNKLLVFLIILIGMLGNIAFFLKFTELRSLVFSILLFLITLGILFFFKRKNYLLIPVAFVYTLLHTTVFLVFIPIFTLLIFDIKNWKNYLSSFLYVLIGVCFAVLVYPSPNFLQILIVQPIIPFI